jgi:biopolymer transport protein ExbD
MAAFSMASMTDVIFLLLIFFMVTSTFVFPTGLEVNLPQSTEQSAIKPVTRVYIDANDSIFASAGEDKPQPVSLQTLPVFLKMANEQDSTGFVALYADETVAYGRIVEVLNIGAENNLKMVLATQPVHRPEGGAAEGGNASASASATVEAVAVDGSEGAQGASVTAGAQGASATATQGAGASANGADTRK